MNDLLSDYPSIELRQTFDESDNPGLDFDELIEQLAETKKNALDSLAFLRKANELAGKAPVTVAVALYQLTVVEGRRCDLLFLPGLQMMFGLSKSGTYRGLAALEQAFLVSVDRQRGRHPIVTITSAGWDEDTTDESPDEEE